MKVHLMSTMYAGLLDEEGATYVLLVTTKGNNGKEGPWKWDGTLNVIEVLRMEELAKNLPFLPFSQLVSGVQEVGLLIGVGGDRLNS